MIKTINKEMREQTIQSICAEQLIVLDFLGRKYSYQNYYGFPVVVEEVGIKVFLVCHLLIINIVRWLDWQN